MDSQPTNILTLLHAVTFNLAIVDSSQCPLNKPRHFRRCCPIEPFIIPTSRKARRECTSGLLVTGMLVASSWQLRFGLLVLIIPIHQSILLVFQSYSNIMYIVGDIEPFPSQSSSSTSPSQSLSTSSPGVIAFAWQPCKRRGYRCIHDNDINEIVQKETFVSVKLYLPWSLCQSWLELLEYFVRFYCLRGLILTYIAKIILFRSTWFFLRGYIYMMKFSESFYSQKYIMIFLNKNCHFFKTRMN